MDFEPTDDQAALQSELRRFLADRVTPEARRAVAELPGAVDRRLWRELAGLGVFGLTLPEADGGVGLGLADATLVFEELGRAAVPGPLIGTFLGAGLGVPGAATGEAVVGLVPAGSPAFVEHLAALDALIVVGDDVTLTGRPPRSRPVARPLDPLTPVDVVDSLPPGERRGGPEAAHHMRTAAALLAAALQVGLADAAVALATGHALARTQFGRPIGAFQAIKHLLADAQVAVEVARAAVQAAGVELDDAGPGGGTVAHRAVDGARLVASRAADRATRTCVQVHGGMGYTWELDAHLYLKRALVLDVGVGSPEEAAAALAAALTGPAGEPGAGPGPAGLAGRRVLVVGASAGIGRAVAARAVAGGAQVVLAARRADALAEAVAAAGGGTPVAGDVCDEAGRDRIVAAAVATLGEIDLVVHAVGIADLRRLAGVDEAAWHTTLHTNVVAFNQVVRLLLPHLAPAGLVAALSSEVAHGPRVGLVPYAASKAALEASLRGWRVEHPEARFTCVVVGATQPSDFGTTFTAEELGAALPAWVRHGQLQEEFMDTDDLAEVLTGALAAVLAVPGVGLDQIVMRSPSPVAMRWSPGPAARRSSGAP